MMFKFWPLVLARGAGTLVRDARVKSCRGLRGRDAGREVGRPVRLGDAVLAPEGVVGCPRDLGRFVGESRWWQSVVWLDDDRLDGTVWLWNDVSGRGMMQWR